MSVYQKRSQQLAEILKKSKPDKIILFGSAAFGKQKRDSDIDLCIIKDGNPLKVKSYAWKLLQESGYDWKTEPDIHVYPPHIFSDYLRRNDPFVEEIAKGKVLYDRSVNRTG